MLIMKSSHLHVWLCCWCPGRSKKPSPPYSLNPLPSWDWLLTPSWLLPSAPARSFKLTFALENFSPQHPRYLSSNFLQNVLAKNNLNNFFSDVTLVRTEAAWRSRKNQEFCFYTTDTDRALQVDGCWHLSISHWLADLSHKLPMKAPINRYSVGTYGFLVTGIISSRNYPVSRSLGLSWQELPHYPASNLIKKW